LRRNFPVNFLLALFFAIIGFSVMGYHPGAEDDGIYLPAIKADLNPALYPHDAAFFQLQLRTTVFDTWMARFIQGTGMSAAGAELLWQSLSILLIVWACWSIVRQLFQEPPAQWAGVALLVAMFTIPVAGTALYIVDQHLHPRNPATALVLFAVARILSGKRWQAVPLLVLAFVLHPLMTIFGISFCGVLVLTLSHRFQASLHNLRAGTIRSTGAPVAVFIPFTWIFAPPSRTWLLAVRSRHWFSIYQWEWYEWLGAVAPLVLFWLVARFAARHGDTNLARFATAVLVYGIFQQTAAMVILAPSSPTCLSTLEPMRYLQLIYVFLMLIGGAYLGRSVLKGRLWRWAVFLLLTNGGMFLVQRQLFAATPHIELPSTASANPWLQAFTWIRQNTPQDAYFALDPHYLALPGNDYHSFRALAERSQLADAIKDTSVVTKVPELGPEWERQVQAQKGWPKFQIQDFKQLNKQFGVDWVLVSYPQPAGLLCRWHNDSLAVCQIP
jgi:hypothetical protein